MRQAYGWKEFKISDLFIQERGREKAPNAVPSGAYPLVDEKSDNNGIQGYCTPKKIFAGNCITVSINSASTVFYQEKDFGASVNIAILRNSRFDKRCYLYVMTLLRKLHANYTYNNKISKDRLNEEIITLPVTVTNDIDFDYMRSYIAELEQSYISKLNIYLKTVGLDNCDLTDEDKNVLQMMENGSMMYQAFKIGSLFSIEKTSSFNKSSLDIKSSKQDYDYVTRTSKNNGICSTTGYIEEEGLNDVGTYSLGLLQMTFFYRERPWYAGQFVRKIVPKIELSKNIALYFEIVFNKISKALSSVLVRDIDSVFENMKIFLPVTVDGDIDFDFMERYMKAIEKLVVMQLYDRREKEIEAAKQVVSS